MNTTLEPLALLLSVDSLIAGLALAPLLRRRSAMLGAAVVFALADGLASALSAVIGLPAGLIDAAPVMLAVYGLYVLAVSVTAGTAVGAAVPSRTRWPVIAAVACALSLDNMVAGAGTSLLAASVASGTMMLAGAAFGLRMVAGLSAPRTNMWAAIGMVAAAAAAVIA